MIGRGCIISFIIFCIAFAGCCGKEIRSRIESLDREQLNIPGRGLVVYYSRSGNTRHAAYAFLEIPGLNLDVEEIVDQTDRRGAMGAFTGGIQGLLGLGTSINSPKHHPKNYDLVIIGTPVWMRRVTPAVRTYLDVYGKHIKRAILFCTYKRQGHAVRSGT